MGRHKIASLFVWLLSFSILAQSQVRDQDSRQVHARDTQLPNTGNQPRSDAFAAKDSLFTGITGERVVLGPGDLLEISVFDIPELTQRVRVNSGDKIALPLIGEVEVKNLTPDALEKLIAQRLIDGHFVKEPQVSVFVAEYAGQMVYITGEVTRPGAYPLLRSHRLRDLISVAGGLTPRAGNKVAIARNGETSQSIQVDLGDKEESQSNPEIVPGDSITVNQTGIVYVLGDVQRPGGFLLDRRGTLSVMQALALAEGTKSSASLSKASLIRTTQTGRQEIPLNIRRILKSQNPDLGLQADDIIFIPGSLTRGMGRQAIETILSTASGVAIYAYRP
jgi:polysaccharide export outer membrane protein